MLNNFCLRCLELVELMTEKAKSSLNSGETEGRQSGSTAWRLARGEMGGEVKEGEGKVWKLLPEEIESQTFHLEYDVVEDCYLRMSSKTGESLKGWSNGVAESQQIMRKVEMDWGQIYLARKGNLNSRF